MSKSIREMTNGELLYRIRTCLSGECVAAANTLGIEIKNGFPVSIEDSARKVIVAFLDADGWLEYIRPEPSPEMDCRDYPH